jgi:TetR/AcrR family transcriptional regulator
VDDSKAPRRDRILAAAEAEFSSEGFGGARIERIAAAAGVNKQLLFHYFHSKRGLFDAAAAVVLSPVRAPSLPDKSPADRLRALVALLVETARSHAGVLLQTSSRGGRSGPSTVALTASQGWLRSAADAVCAIIADGQRSGHYRDDIDPEAVAQVVVAASIGCASTCDPGAGHSQASADSALGDGLVRMVTDYCAWR